MLLAGAKNEVIDVPLTLLSGILRFNFDDDDDDDDDDDGTCWTAEGELTRLLLVKAPAPAEEEEEEAEEDDDDDAFDASNRAFTPAVVAAVAAEAEKKLAIPAFISSTPSQPARNFFALMTG